MTHETASISRRKTVHDRTPNVEELTGAAVGICTTGVAERSTSIDVVFVNKRKAHVLSNRQPAFTSRHRRIVTYTWCVVGSVRGAEDELVTVRICRIFQSRKGPTAAVLDVCQRSWGRV